MSVTIPKRFVPGRNRDTFEAAADAASDVMLTLTPAECDRYDMYVVLASIGAVTIEVTLNGTDWSNPVALQDMAGTLVDQATIITNKNLFGLMGPFYGLRMLASGGAAQACIACRATGRKM